MVGEKGEEVVCYFEINLIFKMERKMFEYLGSIVNASFHLGIGFFLLFYKSFLLEMNKLN